ncbi:MAG: tetratricopeptide repeat protein [Solirubrobacteraceae bacterium]
MTLATRHELASAYRAAGRVAEAIAIYEALLADKERILGTEHPSTLTTRNNLASAYRALGHVGKTTVKWTMYERPRAR